MIPLVKTNRYKHSYILSSISLWNDLNSTIKNLPSIHMFKMKLSQEMFTNARNPTYSFGDRFPSIVHAQMRMGHSTLNYDLHRFGTHVQPSCPSCEGQDETVEHFLLFCPSFAAERHSLLTGVSQIISPGANPRLLLEIDPNRLVQILLNGSSSLTEADNRLIFNHVHEYIKISKRFLRFPP